jgi:signal transduction histidine kinase
MLHKVLKTDESLSSELANNISSEVNRLNALISRFLDFARPTQIEKHPESIPALIDRALKAVHDRWPDAAVEIVRQYAANLPEVPVDAEGEGAARRDVFFPESGFVATDIVRRQRLASNETRDGPLIVESMDSTVVVPPGWTLTAVPSGVLDLTRA